MCCRKKAVSKLLWLLNVQNKYEIEITLMIAKLSTSFQAPKLLENKMLLNFSNLKATKILCAVLNAHLLGSISDRRTPYSEQTVATRTTQVCLSFLSLAYNTRWGMCQNPTFESTSLSLPPLKWQNCSTPSFGKPSMFIGRFSHLYLTYFRYCFSCFI